MLCIYYLQSLQQPYELDINVVFEESETPCDFPKVTQGARGQVRILTQVHLLLKLVSLLLKPSLFLNSILPF